MISTPGPLDSLARFIEEDRPHPLLGADTARAAARQVVTLLADRTEDTEELRDALRELLGDPDVDRPRAAVRGVLDVHGVPVTDEQADLIVHHARVPRPRVTTISTLLSQVLPLAVSMRDDHDVAKVHAWAQQCVDAVRARDERQATRSGPVIVSGPATERGTTRARAGRG